MYFPFFIHDRCIARTTYAVYEGCSLTISTRRRNCRFGVQPVFVWYLTSIVGYCTLFFSINIFYLLGDDSPNTRDQQLLRGIQVTGDTQSSNVESQVFTPYKFYCTGRGSNHQPLHSRPACYRSATQLSMLCTCLFNNLCLHLFKLYRKKHSKFQIDFRLVHSLATACIR